MVCSEAMDILTPGLSSLLKQIPIDFRGVMPEYREVQALSKPWCDLLLLCFFSSPQ